MDQAKQIVCPDCEAVPHGLDRRQFLRSVTTVAAATAAGALPIWSVPRAGASSILAGTPETTVKQLYDTLTPKQRETVCFAWDHKDARGLLRTHVSNNWQITKPSIDSEFFTRDQKDLCHQIWKGILNPDWHEKFYKQLKDDTDNRPWGAAQSIAIFGQPGSDKCEFVMTGRHMTIRADGNSQAHVALGGPIFHGHAASTFNEKVHHPGNIFWHQAELANKVYQMMDSKQRKASLVARRPAESAVAFRGPMGKFPGIPVTELGGDQKDHLTKVLLSLIEPYRKEDQDEVKACLQKQGGLDKCSLAFYRDGDIGDDEEWDNWRLEGPAFIWYFRGHPHVHIWINVADDPSVPLNARG